MSWLTIKQFVYITVNDFIKQKQWTNVKWVLLTCDLDLVNII